MLFSREIPEALLKLNELIDQVRAKGSAYKFRESHKRTLFPEEHGFYFVNKRGEDVLWFGMWALFWKREGFPLCFGVDDKWPARQSFLSSFKGKPMKQLDGYTLGWISQETLASENAAEEIWKQLEPVLKAVVAAGT